MRATTNVALTLSHIGAKGSRLECWEGTFAHCLIELAKFLGNTSMATRFDLCLARSPEEARAALAKRSHIVTLPDGANLEEELLKLMNEDAPSKASEPSANQGCIHGKAAGEHCNEGECNR